jgi:hypothetical protein
MQTFEAEEIRAYLAENGGLDGADEEKTEFSMKMSGGALGAVKELISPENGEYEAYKKATELLASLGKKNRSVSYFEFLSSLTAFADSGEKLSLLLKYLTALYRDILSAQNSEEIPLDILDDDTAVHYAALFSVRTALSALTLITEVKKNMSFNTNLGLSAYYLAENLWRIT